MSDKSFVPAYGVYCEGELDIVEYTRDAADRHARSLVKHLNFERSAIKVVGPIAECDLNERLSRNARGY